MNDQTLLYECVVFTPSETEKFAQSLALILKRPDLVALSGPLGAGKSTLARALIRARTHPEQEVPSPTFTLIQSYETQDGWIHHMDAYRLKDPNECIELGWDDYRTDLCLIEWPEHLLPLLPPTHLWIRLDPDPTHPHARRIRLTSPHPESWVPRFASFFHT